MSTPKITESDSRTGVSTKAPDHFAESIEKIYQKAKEQGLGDKWLARKLGTSQQNVNRWRRGKARPPDLTVESIAHKLDLHIEDLLSGRIADKPSRYGLPSINKDQQLLLDRCQAEIPTLEKKWIRFIHAMFDLRKKEPE